MIPTHYHAKQKACTEDATARSNGSMHSNKVRQRKNPPNLEPEPTYLTTI